MSSHFFHTRAGKAVVVGSLVVSAAVTVAFLAVSDFIDMLVYRMGARVLLDGGAIYGEMPPVVDDFGLPFTYPPLAAMLFVPLTLTPLLLGKLLFTLVSVAALAVTLRVVLGRVRPELGTRASWTVTAVAVAVSLLVEPVRETISFGQINLVLMALVAVDVLTKNPKWPRGLLIGLAAAIKLTPIGFLLLFLLLRDRRTSGTILVSAFGFTALAYLAMPEASTRYWMETLPDTGRIGPAYFATNESLKAVITRFGPPELVGSVLWLVAVVIVLAVAVIAMRRALEQGNLVAALLANATAILLASPVSWSHHWVWVAPALLVLTFAVLRRPSRWTTGVSVAIAAIFLIGPQHLLPTGQDLELDWTLWQHLLGTLYVSVGFGFLVWLGVVRYQGRTTVDVLDHRPITVTEGDSRPIDSRP